MLVPGGPVFNDIQWRHGGHGPRGRVTKDEVDGITIQYQAEPESRSTPNQVLIVNNLDDAKRLAEDILRVLS